MIYFAKFTGRPLGSISVDRACLAYCRGDDEEQARNNLYERYDHIQGLQLTEAPIKTAGECKPGDRIYLVVNGWLIGRTAARHSAFTVLDKPRNPDAPTFLLCLGDTGRQHLVAEDQTCIVRQD